MILWLLCSCRCCFMSLSLRIPCSVFRLFFFFYFISLLLLLLRLFISSVVSSSVGNRDGFVPGSVFTSMPFVSLNFGKIRIFFTFIWSGLGHTVWPQASTRFSTPNASQWISLLVFRSFFGFWESLETISCVHQLIYYTICIRLRCVALVRIQRIRINRFCEWFSIRFTYKAMFIFLGIVRHILYHIFRTRTNRRE